MGACASGGDRFSVLPSESGEKENIVAADSATAEVEPVNRGSDTVSPSSDEAVPASVFEANLRIPNTGSTGKHFHFGPFYGRLCQWRSRQVGGRGPRCRQDAG